MLFKAYLTYLCFIFPQPSRLSWCSQRINQQFNGHANLLFPQNISIVLSRLCSSSEMIFSTSCVHVPGVALAQHSEATLTPRVIHMFECVCVRGEWDHNSLSRKKIALRSPLTGVSSSGSNLNRSTPKQGLWLWAAL